MQRHLIKKKNLMKWETPTAKKEPTFVSICRLPKMEKTMADGEKDEEMKPRGGSI